MYDPPRDVVPISNSGGLIDMSKLLCTVEAPPRDSNRQVSRKDFVFPKDPYR